MPRNEQESYKSLIERITFKLIDSQEEGVSLQEIKRKVLTENSDISQHTIRFEVGQLAREYPDRILRKDRGVYGRASDLPIQEYPTEREQETDQKKEKPFYDPLVDFLLDKEECEYSSVLGNNRVPGFWNTPDVIGTKRSPRSHLIQYTTELISAEVKYADKQREIITGFGQAVAYKLFSNKVYLVIPSVALEARVIELCMNESIGLIKYDRTNPSKPRMDFVLRAPFCRPNPTHTRDWVEELMGRIKDEQLRKSVQYLFE